MLATEVTQPLLTRVPIRQARLDTGWARARDRGYGGFAVHPVEQCDAREMASIVDESAWSAARRGREDVAAEEVESDAAAAQASWSALSCGMVECRERMGDVDVGRRR